MVSRPIIIPSKNIYRKDNQKVITNLIDKIEVQQKIPQIISTTENVYNNTLRSQSFINDKEESAETKYVASPSLQDYGTLYYTLIKITPTYSKTSFTIPKNIGNMSISYILDGIDKNDQPNIKTNINGLYQYGYLDGYCNVSNVSNNGFNINDIVITGTVQEDERSGSYTLFHTNKTYTSEWGLDNATLNDKTKASLNFITKDNVLEIKAEPQENEYVLLNLTVLVGLTITEIKADKYSEDISNITSLDFWKTSYQQNVQCKSTYEKYIPNELSISVAGSVIKLDIQDNTLTVNDGVYRYAFSGNELMQSTNLPTVKDTYEKVITQYKNGKEVAEIKCNVDEYYDTFGELAVSKTPRTEYNNPKTIEVVSRENATTYRTKSVAGIVQGDVLYYQNESAVCGAYVSSGGQWLREIKVKENGLFANMLGKGEFVVNLNLPPKEIAMTFHIGDVVIPYVYTAKGEDRPMSYYPDNTPKQFVVVGKGISYRGRVYQNLTLQEILQPSTNTAVIQIGGELGGGGSYSNYEVYLKFGNLEIGDTIKYKNDTATIEDFEDNYYIARLQNGGELQAAEGQTISVEIVK